MDVDTVIAQRVWALRKTRGYSLDQLAALSGVSRSMISLIERHETSPTAVVLNKLASALGESLAALFSQEQGCAEAQPLARRSDQHLWTDPESGYVRRRVSPSGYPSPVELVEVLFPAGKSVAFENAARGAAPHQQVWVLEGEIDVTVEDRSWHLEAGDCLAVETSPHIIFRNKGRRPARYLVAVSAVPFPSRNT